MSLVLTRAGWALCGLACMLFLASMQSTTGLLFLVLGVVTGCVVVNAFAAVRAVRSLRATPLERLRGTEGGTLTSPWEVEADASRSGMLTVSCPLGDILSTGLVKGPGRSRVRAALPLTRRGVHRFDRVRLASTYPFGLVRCSRHSDHDAQITVVPRTYPCPPPVACGFEPMLGGKHRGAFRSSSGEHLHGVRPYQDGDAVRLIHWPSSARGRGIMVREYDEQLSGRVAVLVQCTGALSGDGASILDWAARAAASLALAALDEGHRTELADPATAEISSFTPFSDPDAVLDLLAGLEPARIADGLGALEDTLARLPSRAALCWVLTDPAAFLSALRDPCAEPIGERSRTVAVPDGTASAALEDIHTLGTDVRIYGPESIARADSTR